jgi:hypothetical protein
VEYAVKVDVHSYKRALMEEIVGRTLYKEADLRRLFARELKRCPFEEKHVLREAIDQLKQELCVG